MSNNNCCATDLLLPPNSKYKIYEKIGSGAYGEVYKGTRDDDGLSVALKRVMITDEDGYNNIPLSTHRELNVLRRLNKLGNDNIVRLFDIVLNKIGERMCIDLVFELSEYDLETYLKKFNLRGDMKIDKILNLGQQLMDGVHFMHSYRVLHRDLKPANILIDCHGTDLKITDFGLARILGFDAALTPIAVTLWYRSPEILFKNSYLTACDVWSVGCIIGEMVYGRPLFAAENEVNQMGKIVCRLGYEAINNWPDDSFIDSSSFVEAIDPSRSLDRVLRRADIGLRSLIESLLRFDPDQRMLSTDALVRLKELRKVSPYCNDQMFTCNGSSMIGQMCSLPDSVNDSQQFTVVDSVVRNGLDDDFTELAIPGVGDCQSINDYPHEEVEVIESSDISLAGSRSSSTSISSPGQNENAKQSPYQQAKDADEVGDSFSSYRSQNHESFSSYSPSPQTGAETTDDDLITGNDLHELYEFKKGIIISAGDDVDSTDSCEGDNGSGSDTCRADMSGSKNETIVVWDEEENESPRRNEEADRGRDYNDENRSPPPSETTGLNISPFQIAVDNLDHGPCIEGQTLARQKSAPLKEVNAAASVSPAQKGHVTRKRIITCSDEESDNELENNSPLVVRPVLARHKSLRRRLSVVGSHESIDRRCVTRCASVAVPAAIGENEEIQNISFGEHSLLRALDGVAASPQPPKGAPCALSDRPRIIVRRRSQFK